MRLLTLPGVFSPRSDSWLLANAASRAVSEGDEALDPFTGSGVVAIATARSGASATAVDVSRRAVACARLNARLNGVRIEGINADSLAALDGRRFDLIAANPPYVPGPEIEPRGASRAWEGGPDGRRFVDRLCRDAPGKLKPGGRVLVVHSSLLGEASTLELLEKGGLEASVIERRPGELGPLMAERLEQLRALNGGEAPDREEILIFEGRAGSPP